MKLFIKLRLIMLVRRPERHCLAWTPQQHNCKEARSKIKLPFYCFSNITLSFNIRLGISCLTNICGHLQTAWENL